MSRWPEPVTSWLHPAVVGERVSVGAPATGDEPALVEMGIDPEVCRYLSGPVDRPTSQDRAARKVSDPRWGEFVIVDRASKTMAGSGSLARKRGPWEISNQSGFVRQFGVLSREE